MRNIHYSFLGLFALFFTTSGTIKSPESNRLFEKIIFVELTMDKDSALFQPYSKAWKARWSWGHSADIKINDTELMNSDKYKFSFKNRRENIWTILHPMIIDGSVQSYFPFDPTTFGLGDSDDGELRYPITNGKENETFLTSEKVRENLCIVLGQFGPESDIPLVDEWGDPIIVTLADGTQEFAYPPRDYYWYKDKDITSYKLRVSVLLNKKGKEKKRVIKSICPIANQMTETGEPYDKELLWLNFEELESTLEEAYFFDENMKPITFLEYIQQKVKNTAISGRE